MTQPELNSKVALVTGGSRGIGRAIALELAGRGARLFINYASNSAAAEETVAQCQKLGVQAEAMGFDVGSFQQVDAAFAKIKESAGKLDILVNNAGITADGLVLRLKNEDWDRVIATNLSGAIYCSRAAAKLMLRVPAGRIINITSVVGQMGNAGQVAYVSAKAGLIGMTKALAKELATRAITVNAVAPGFIDTEMTSQLSDEIKTEMLKVIPLGRYGASTEVASVVSFLASEGAAYVTGQVIGVNGGMYM